MGGTAVYDFMSLKLPFIVNSSKVSKLFMIFSLNRKHIPYFRTYKLYKVFNKSNGINPLVSNQF